MSETSSQLDRRSLVEHRAQRVRGMEELIGEQLRPPSLEDEERLYLMTPEELKERHERRVELFQRLLDAERGGTPLTAGEIHTMKMWLRAVNGMDRYLTEAMNGNEEGSILTDEQLQVFQNVHLSLETGHSSGYVALPTGGGKTVIFSEMVEAMNVPTLIAVPTLDLVTQTKGKLNQFAPAVDTGVVMGGTKQISEQATVITYDSLCNLVESGELKPEDFSCLILDEAHLSLSPRRQEVMNRFSHAIRIGFTATPDYAETKKLSDLLPHEIHKVSILEAVEKKIICGFRVMLAQTRVSIDGVRRTAQKGYDKKQLEKAINIEARNRSAVELYLKLATHGEKAIFFCAGVQHAKDMAEALKKADVFAECIYGEMGKNERKDVLRRSQSGETRALCGADLLVCGYDDPEVKFVFMLAESQSVVRVTQSAGRGLRQKFTQGAPEPKQATIVQFIDSYSSPDAAPVLFSDIAGGAVILSSGGESSDPKRVTDRELLVDPLPKIDVTGLKVITDAAEVMRVTRETVRAKELFGMRPNENGWFVIDGKEYGTIQRCAKDVDMTPKAARDYVEQAEKGGRTFSTEEKHGANGVTDLFLREELGAFLRERSEVKKLASPSSLLQGEAFSMQVFEEIPSERILFKEGEDPVCEIAGKKWAAVEYIASQLSISPLVLRGWLTYLRPDLLPMEARKWTPARTLQGKRYSARNEDAFIFPMDRIQEDAEVIIPQWEAYSKKEEERRSNKKAFQERIDARGWFRHAGAVYVNFNWITEHLNPPSQMPSFNTVASRVLQLPAHAIVVAGLKMKFYPVSAVYKAYRTVPHSAKDVTEPWRRQLAEPAPETFIGDEADDEGLLDISSGRK